MKKIWISVWLTLCCILLFPGCAWALESDGFEYNIKDGKATITKYIGPTGENVDVIVPSVLSGCPVTVFGGGNKVFAWRNIKLRRVVLPDTVIKIGESAFEGSVFNFDIKEVILSNNLQVIDNDAFNDSKLKSILLPSTLKTIGKNAFRESDITSIDLPDSVTDIGEWAFFSSSLTSCQMSAGVKTISKGMFADSKLERITLKNGLESIGDFPFQGCKNLKRVDIPFSVKNIGVRAFNECKSLEYVNIPYGVTKIYERTFDKCESLKELIIPHSVVEIEKGAFNGCRSLTSLVIPDSVTSIDDIINKCDNLESVIVPSSVVKGSFFEGSECPKMIVHVKAGSYAEKMAMKKSKLSVVADDSVDYIASIQQETLTAVPAAPVWKQDSVGWWLERPDGSYLVNEWYQYPSNGLWYYMGPDGYMLTNTTTPDGYWVNVDGSMSQ